MCCSKKVICSALGAGSAAFKPVWGTPAQRAVRAPASAMDGKSRFACFIGCATSKELLWDPILRVIRVGTMALGERWQVFCQEAAYEPAVLRLILLDN